VINEGEELQALRAHERECAIRYQNIERQLGDGKEKFSKIENMVIGLYGIIITGGLAIFGVVATLAIKLS
tara:strand:- start:4 stop:213 length:210 start_codon:yes stop_codon:yes gene_type:complete